MIVSKRSAAQLSASLLLLLLLAACGRQSAFCEAAENSERTLLSFGLERTDAAFSQYAEVTAELSELAPDDVIADWRRLDEVTTNVVAQHRMVGVALEDLSDQAVADSLSPAVLGELNSAYEQFNGTRSERERIVTHLENECGLELDQVGEGS